MGDQSEPDQVSDPKRTEPHRSSVLAKINVVLWATSVVVLSAALVVALLVLSWSAIGTRKHNAVLCNEEGCYFTYVWTGCDDRVPRLATEAETQAASSEQLEFWFVHFVSTLLSAALLFALIICAYRFIQIRNFQRLTSRHDCKGPYRSQSHF